MRRFIILLGALLLLGASAALAQGAFPKKIALPNAFAPEGIEIGNGHTVLRRLRRQRRDLGRQPAHRRRPDPRRRRRPRRARRDRDRVRPRPALGLGCALRQRARLQREDGCARSREIQLATGAAPTFINDAVVTKKGVYFTDSQRPCIYRVATRGNGRPGAVTTIPLGGDYQHVAGQFNLNGIVATENGKTLIAVQSFSRKLLTIDPKTGVAKLIDLGGYDLSNGDGLLLRGPDALRRPEPRQQGRRLRALARPVHGDVPARR